MLYYGTIHYAFRTSPTARILFLEGTGSSLLDEANKGSQKRAFIFCHLASLKLGLWAIGQHASFRSTGTMLRGQKTPESTLQSANAATWDFLLHIHCNPAHFCISGLSPWDSSAFVPESPFEAVLFRRSGNETPTQLFIVCARPREPRAFGARARPIEALYPQTSGLASARASSHTPPKLAPA